MYYKVCNKNFLIWKEKISSRKERLSPRKEKLSYHVARGRISIQGECALRPLRVRSAISVDALRAFV